MQKKFRYKLNMLEPGTKICKLILLLFCAGILLYLFHAKTAGFIILVIAAARPGIYNNSSATLVSSSLIEMC